MEEIKWRAPEYEQQPKSIIWFWSTIFISLIFLAIAIWQKNFLFAIFIIIAEVLILIWGATEPKIIEFKIDDNGIYIDKYNFYNFSDIKNFSYTESIWPEFILLKINFKKKMRLNISILVPKEKIKKIQNIFIEKNIPETEYEEHFLEVIQKLIKF